MTSTTDYVVVIIAIIIAVIAIVIISIVPGKAGPVGPTGIRGVPGEPGTSSAPTGPQGATGPTGATGPVSIRLPIINTYHIFTFLTESIPPSNEAVKKADRVNFICTTQDKKNDFNITIDALATPSVEIGDIFMVTNIGYSSVYLRPSNFENISSTPNKSPYRLEPSSPQSALCIISQGSANTDGSYKKIFNLSYTALSTYFLQQH